MKAKLRATEPFDLSLSLKAAFSFSKGPESPSPVLRIAARINRDPLIIVVRPSTKHPAVFEVSASQGFAMQACKIASYVMNADFDIRPFYSIALAHPKMRPVVKALQGLRPLRPASLFEMLVTAITEQQISLRFAYSIRERMTSRFGDIISGVPVFPDEVMLARTSLTDLLSCGLSHRKAEYIRDLSAKVASKQLDLARLEQMTDDEIYLTLTGIRGIGPWTADYVMVRGLGRPDRVPLLDIGIRKVVGKYLASEERAEPSRVQTLLKPFVPFRGLAAYYLLVYERMFQPKEPVS